MQEPLLAGKRSLPGAAPVDNSVRNMQGYGSPTATSVPYVAGNGTGPTLERMGSGGEQFDDEYDGESMSWRDSEQEHMHLSNKGDVWDIPDEPPDACFSFRTLWAYTGPGFLMCIAYLDPGNLEADLQVGAYTGYMLLWVLLLATLAGLLLQSMAARLGVVTGTHLADICRRKYPKPAAMCLWTMAELAIIGSDIQEVLGSAIAINILTGIPLWAGCLITAVDTFTFLGMHLFGVRKLEALFVSLVGVMTVAFLVNFGQEAPATRALFSGLVPRIQSYATVTALGLVGAVIMPHNIYLHSALVLSRAVDRDSTRKMWEANKYYTIDAAMALAVAFVINLAVVGTFAGAFYDPACAYASTMSACLTGDSIDVNSDSYGPCAGGAGECQEIGLIYAGDALKGALGSSAKYVWAVGLLAAGQSSTMTGTYAGQFVMEGFLKLSIPQWQRVLLTRVIALGPALSVTLALRDDTTATDYLSGWLNVLQSLMLPFALIPLLHFVNSAKIMGVFRVNPWVMGVLWAISFFVIGINVYIVTEDLWGIFDEWWQNMLIIAAGIGYLLFCAYLISEDASVVVDWCLRKGRGRAEPDWATAPQGSRPHDFSLPPARTAPAASATDADRFGNSAGEGETNSRPFTGAGKSNHKAASCNGSAELLLPPQSRSDQQGPI